MIVHKTPFDKIKIDLDGPQGNAFAILGLAQRLGRELGKSKNEMEEIQNQMKACDYENLLEVFDNYYGDYVIMETSQDYFI